MKMSARRITEQEWNEYNWIEVPGETVYGDLVVVFLKGIKRKSPPQDGYHYVETTTFGDTEQKWSLAVTPE